VRAAAAPAEAGMRQTTSGTLNKCLSMPSKNSSSIGSDPFLSTCQPFSYHASAAHQQGQSYLAETRGQQIHNREAFEYQADRLSEEAAAVSAVAKVQRGTELHAGRKDAVRSSLERLRNSRTANGRLQRGQSSQQLQACSSASYLGYLHHPRCSLLRAEQNVSNTTSWA